jgi:hypothetical protein
MKRSGNTLADHLADVDTRLVKLTQAVIALGVSLLFLSLTVILLVVAR